MRYFRCMFSNEDMRLKTTHASYAKYCGWSTEAAVEVVGKTGVSDGLLLGPDGKIYVSALEHHAILRTSPTGEVETVAQGGEIESSLFICVRGSAGASSHRIQHLLNALS